MKWGAVGGRGKGNVEQKGEGGQYTANQGPEWTGIAPRQRRDFQVSKKGFKEYGRDSKQRGLSRGLGYALRYHANLVHIVLIAYMSC